MLRYLIPLAVYASLILYLSTQTSDELPDWQFPDKLLHFAEYGGLGFLWFRFLRFLPRVLPLTQPLVSLALRSAVPKGWLASPANKNRSNRNHEARSMKQEARKSLSCLLLPASCFFGLLVFAAADELLQGLTPTRDPAWGDLVADLVGGMSGALLYWFLKDYVLKSRPGAGNRKHDARI